MAHALEAYTSALKKNPLSDILSLQALRLLTSNIHAACRDSSGTPAVSLLSEATSAREAMLLGSSLAGMAFANAPVGAAHALAYPLGTQFKVPHGLSVSLMLPHVMRFNAYDPSATKLYSSIADTVLEHIDLAATDDGKARQLIDYFSRLPQELGLPTHLAEVGVSDTDVPSMAAEAMLQTRLLPNNVRHPCDPPFVLVTEGSERQCGVLRSLHVTQAHSGLRPAISGALRRQIPVVALRQETDSWLVMARHPACCSGAGAWLE
eukprot:scaffold157401_cov28-Tisochrysis_lutea.AAC.2